MQQTLGVKQHQLVELPPLRFIDLAPLQSLKIKAYGRDWGLQLVGHRINKAVVLFVAANFSYQENCIEDQACNDDQKKYAAKKKLQPFAPILDDPTDVQRYGRRNQTHTQRYKKVNRLLPADDPHR